MGIQQSPGNNSFCIHVFSDLAPSETVVDPSLHDLHASTDVAFISSSL